MYSGFVVHEIKLWCQFLDPVLLGVKPGVIFPPPAEPRGMLSMMITSVEMDSCDSAKWSPIWFKSYLSISIYYQYYITYI